MVFIFSRPEVSGKAAPDPAERPGCENRAQQWGEVAAIARQALFQWLQFGQRPGIQFQYALQHGLSFAQLNFSLR